MTPDVQVVSFEADAVGSAPAGWTCGVTGRGTPHWTVEADASAPGTRRVLKQSGAGTFPWCVRQGTALEHGFVEVKFKPLAGKEDQAGGVVWRWKDANTYYVARANALEGNVSLYWTEGGQRKTIKYVDAPVAGNRWHTLRAAFTGDRIRISLDGVMRIDVVDSHLAGPGAVGVWTKADSVTAFDDFAFGPAAK
jgi:hypothetical protein